MSIIHDLAMCRKLCILKTAITFSMVTGCGEQTMPVAPQPTRSAAPVASAETFATQFSNDQNDDVVPLVVVVRAPAGFTKSTRTFAYRMPPNFPRSVQSVTQGPIEGAQILLENAVGQSFTGFDEYRTDQAGVYRFERTGIGSQYVVRAMIASASSDFGAMVALVTVSPLGGYVEVTAASTLVTAALMKDRTTFPVYSPANYQRVVDLVEARLTNSNLPDFAKNDSWSVTFDAMAKTAPEIRQAFSELMAPTAK